MKHVFRALLICAICVLGYMCVTSITSVIEFDKARELRETAIKKNLIEIRKAQIEYQKVKGVICANTDTLVDFILNGKLPVVLKEGTLTDEQLKNGLTEEKALKIVKKGNMKEIIKNGLEGFRRDTSYVNVYETLFAEQYSREDIPNLMVIPYSNNEKFLMDTARITNYNTGYVLPLFEACAPYDSYLGDLDHQQLVNLKDYQTKLERYCGLKVGSVTESNNHAGNWE